MNSQPRFSSSNKLQRRSIFVGILILSLMMILSSMSVKAQSSGKQAADSALYLPMVMKPLPPVGPELVNAYNGLYNGRTVTMLGPFSGTEETIFNNSIHDFEIITGIDIAYTGTSNFDEVISTLVESGIPPDIADFPNPGFLAGFATQGKVLDLGQIVNPAWLSQNYKQSWLDMATMPGTTGPITAGIWARANGKDLVWYPKAAFDAAGYTVPTSWNELISLSNQIVADGDTPWCIGIESGAATGWPATDWIEALMLRTGPLSNYDNWVNGTLKFNSPEVRTAISYMTQIWFNDTYVYGGRSSIALTNFGDAPLPMFDNPPKCWLHKQGSFITNFFPEGLTPGVDYDFFYLPPISPTYGEPFEIVGDIYAEFNDRPEVRAVIQYFTLGQSLKTWIEAGGVIAPQNDASIEWYTDPIYKKIAQTMQQSTAVRFDGSDMMPGEVGAGTFWSEITAYINGTHDLDTVLNNIDASWPP
jgi:alpha-glucoside transport system substrate-binding protein